MPDTTLSAFFVRRIKRIKMYPQQLGVVFITIRKSQWVFPYKNHYLF